MASFKISFIDIYIKIFTAFYETCPMILICYRSIKIIFNKFLKYFNIYLNKNC